MSRPIPLQTSPVLTSREAAAHLGVQPQTLRKWRVSGKGPTYIRLGNSPRARVAYRLRDLDQWLDARSYESTAAETVAIAS